MCTSESSDTFLPNSNPTGDRQLLLATKPQNPVASRRGNNGVHAGQASLDFPNHPHEPPILCLGQWAALHDLHGVSLMRFVLLVVDVANRSTANVLTVAR